MAVTCVTVDNVIVAINHLSDKSLAADVLPVLVMKQVAVELAMFLSELYNCLLNSGTFPSMHRSDYITTILKKPNLDPDNVKSNRPISNLSAVS